MDDKSHGPTIAQYNTYGDGNTSRSISKHRSQAIEAVYKILPQDNKRRKRNERKKINTFLPRTPYLFITSKSAHLHQVDGLYGPNPI